MYTLCLLQKNLEPYTEPKNMSKKDWPTLRFWKGRENYITLLKQQNDKFLMFL